jgi:putative hemolysin
MVYRFGSPVGNPKLFEQISSEFSIKGAFTNPHREHTRLKHKGCERETQPKTRVSRLKPSFELGFNMSSLVKNDLERLVATVREYVPTLPFTKDFRKYKLKIAETPDELMSVLHLRHQIFFGTDGIDFDLFDTEADHLMLMDESTGQVVGTYRLMNSLRSKEFYSQGEFEMDSILALPGVKLELGRACIHPDYRTGSAIAIVWQGLGEYMRRLGADWLFGCSSVSFDPDLESSVAMNRAVGRSLLKHASGHDLRVTPRNPYRHEGLDFRSELKESYEMDSTEERLAQRGIPPLLKGYLRLGAKICGAPSWDPEFCTLDYFTLVEVATMDESFRSRFGVENA